MQSDKKGKGKKIYLKLNGEELDEVPISEEPPTKYSGSKEFKVLKCK